MFQSQPETGKPDLLALCKAHIFFAVRKHGSSLLPCSLPVVAKEMSSLSQLLA